MQPVELPELSVRSRGAHKGDFGRAFIIGGSRGMTGAVGLAAMAAHRAGAGLVTAVVPDRCLDTVASYSPNYTTCGLSDDAGGRFDADAVDEAIARCSQATSIGLGPGLGRSPKLTRFVGQLYATLDRPLVLDADGLNAMADEEQNVPLTTSSPRVLTPHVGEFGRLVGTKLTESDCRKRVLGFAAEHHVIAVLKGPGSLVTDGERVYENETGNPGMATGGSGDVLTGIIAALLGQFTSAFDATVAAVFLHGLAGDLAAEALGETSLVASDLIDYLPMAFQRYPKNGPQ